MNETNPSNEKNKFNIKEMLKDKRKKAGLTLGLYVLFFILVFIYMGSLGDSKTTEDQINNNENNNTDTYDYGQITYSKYTPLMNNNYKYKVNYYIGDKEDNYEGERKDDNYSVIPEEDYILEVKDVLNIDSILELIKKSKLYEETKYFSGVVLQTYNVPINSFCDEYDIVLNNETDNIIMKVYANTSYVDKIYFDITNLANSMDNNITKYEVEVYYSNVNSIK
ncbi:MAG: hypothetical protein WDA21_00180 [Bacilli bacterium]